MVTVNKMKTASTPPERLSKISMLQCCLVASGCRCTALGCCTGGDNFPPKKKSRSAAIQTENKVKMGTGKGYQGPLTFYEQPGYAFRDFRVSPIAFRSVFPRPAVRTICLNFRAPAIITGSDKRGNCPTFRALRRSRMRPTRSCS